MLARAAGVASGFLSGATCRAPRPGSFRTILFRFLALRSPLALPTIFRALTHANGGHWVPGFCPPLDIESQGFVHPWTLDRRVSSILTDIGFQGTLRAASQRISSRTVPRKN